MKLWTLLALISSCGCHLLQSEGARCTNFTNCPDDQICCDGECRADGCLTPCTEDLSCPAESLCNPERNLCVPFLDVGCERPEQVCPERVETGDPCDIPDAFIPCSSDALGCDQGCRTCNGRFWSECSAGTCTRGTLHSCSSCTDDCTTTVLNATPACAPAGEDFACDYAGSCFAGFSDNDGVRSNGCESFCVPSNGGVERCDGVDNDCNGDLDDMAPGAIDADCLAQYDQTNVAAWSCIAGGCAVETCIADSYDLNGLVLDGCEYACNSSGGNETCNGIDDDCNGVTDDVADAHAECGLALPAAVNVQQFICTSGACAIGTCVPGYRNTDAQTATGCDSVCTGAVGEVCDGIDNDCNGVVDDAPDDATGCVELYPDEDGDGDGDHTGSSRCLCGPTGAYTAGSNDDCDDDDPSRSGLTPEKCDNVDNNCDSMIDNGLNTCRCTNDAPLAREVCYDGIDDDCNGVVDDACSCPPSLPFCLGDRSALATCDANGNEPVLGTTTPCAYLCSQATCAGASNVGTNETSSCGPTAPPLAVPAGGTLAYTNDTIYCSPDCGDGSTSELHPVVSVTVAEGESALVFCVSRLAIPTGIELTAHATATQAVIILVDGDAVIDGTINIDGRDGLDGPGFSVPGAAPGPGGWAGAAGCGANNCVGRTGEGPGGGHGGWRGIDGSSGGGGGAGFAGGGGDGGDTTNGTGGAGGDAYGTNELVLLAGGSGGGSGGDGEGGSGSGPGGGGGGAIQISVRGTLTVNGTISAKGGQGGSPLGDYVHGAGGGGSGGGVLLEAGALSVFGSINVSGGSGGSNTGSGVGGLGAIDTIGGNPGGNGSTLGGGGGGGASGRVRFNSASGTTCAQQITPPQACTAGTL